VYSCEWDHLDNYLIAAGAYLFLLGGIHLAFFQSKALGLFSLPGRYSYGNYLFHIAVLYMIHSFLWNLNIVLAFLAYIAAATTVAALSFRFFEKPANHHIRRLFGVKG
jgi:peptidoglycan/LPS O-acetylase OafA/YrhL